MPQSPVKNGDSEIISIIMSVQVAKSVMQKYLNPFLFEYGFSEKKIRNSDFQYFRKLANGSEEVSGGFLSYPPRYTIIYGVGKELKVVNDITKKVIKLSDNLTLIFSYELLNKMDHPGYLGEMVTENDVMKCVERMKDFLENTAFPMLEKFNDLREIDKIINGDPLWQFDSDKPIRVSGGGNFFLNRIIIAHLVNNPKFDEIVTFQRAYFDEQIKGEYAEDFEEAYKILINLLEILKTEPKIYV